MLSSRIKDIKLRTKFNKLEKKRRLNRFVFTNILSSKHSLQAITTNFSTVSSILNKKQNSKVQLTRRCVLSNRNRGVLRTFGISRIHLRELMQFGLIPGYSKAVW